MRHHSWLLLILLLTALAGGCGPETGDDPGRTPHPSLAAAPKWMARLQLTIQPDVHAAHASRDGSMLLVPGEKALSLVSNTAGRLNETVLSFGDDPVLDSALSADGAWLAVVTANRLQVYSLPAGVLQSSVSWLQAVTSAGVQISQDGQSIACLRNGYLHLYHGPELSLRWSSELAASNQQQQLQMSANGLTLAVCGDEAIVFAPDAASPLWKRPLAGEFRLATLSADGVYLAVESKTADGEQLLLFERWHSSPAWEFSHQGAVTCLRFSPSGNWLALSADQFYLFDCLNAQPVIRIEQPGSAALAEQQVLLISEQTLYRFHTRGQQVVSYRLPDLLAGEVQYVHTETEWVFALDSSGQVHLIRLPLASTPPAA